MGRAAAGEAAEGSAGGGISSALKAFGKMGPVPMPHMGSNGPSNLAGSPEANSVLNADQFR